MAYNSIMNTVYNHYLTTYAPKKTSSQYDTREKSELRSIYNSMVKLNKDAPLYSFWIQVKNPVNLQWLKRKCPSPA